MIGNRSGVGIRVGDMYDVISLLHIDADEGLKKPLIR